MLDPGELLPQTPKVDAAYIKAGTLLCLVRCLTHLDMSAHDVAHLMHKLAGIGSGATLVH